MTGGVVRASLTDLILAGCALATVLGALALFIWRKGIRPLTKFASEFKEDWKGEPARPGVPARLGVMERLERIEGQLKPNGGTSFYDKVTQAVENNNQQPSAVVNIHPKE